MPIKLKHYNKLLKHLSNLFHNSKIASRGGYRSYDEIAGAWPPQRRADTTPSPRGAVLNYETLHGKVNRRIIPIPNNNSVSKIKTLNPLRVLAPFGYSALLLAIFGIFHALTNINNVSALSISVDSISQSLDITSGNSGVSPAITVSVTASDSLAGYTLKLTGPNDDKQLRGNSGTSTTNVLSPITSSGIALSSFSDNQWGLKYCKKANTSDTCINTTNTYSPAPGTTALDIDKTSTSNSTAVQYAIAIGAKVAANKSADTYSGNFILTASENPVYHSVGFVDWSEGIPDAIAGTGTSVNIPNVTPTKDGYTFKGWCTVKTTDDTCSGIVVPVGKTGHSLADTVSNGTAYTNLYAMWEKNLGGGAATSAYVMQDITNWRNKLAAGDIAFAIDIRDYRAYKVSKLADGKIWMLDNLAFNGTNASGTYIQMNSTNTNITGTRTWSSSVNWTNQSNTYTAPLINVGSLTRPTSGDTRGGLAAATTVNWKYGAYYNYCAATAQTMCDSSYSNATNASQDVCPAGWRMPTGGASGEYQNLAKALVNESSSFSDSTKYKTFRETLHIPLSGNYYNGSATDQSLHGYFWSSTWYSSTNMYRLEVSTSGVYPQSNSYRSNSLSVRCVTSGS